MATKNNNNEFLCRRLKELREKNGISMDEMAKLLNKGNRSSVSRVESGNTSYDTLVSFAKKYCMVFKLDDLQTQLFLRGDKIAVPDTSALLNNIQLIEELSKEYSHIVIPKTVIDELDNIKNRTKSALGRKAWEIIKSIGNDETTLKRDYTGDPREKNNDCRIIHIAREVSQEFGCQVDIITNDADYSAYLKGDESIKALPLREYMATKQDLVSMTRMKEIDEYYALNYDAIKPPTPQEVNAYFDNGNTLLISTVLNRKVDFLMRKNKIIWLIKHGADINKRDCARHYFPALSHAIQMNDYKMFIFLLKECQADPNAASRNPHSAHKVRQRNEGNMPLMIAAWEGKDAFVKALCNDSRTSINQQDANGFTALIKACANLNFKCRDILINSGADTKIIDINGKNYQDHIDEAYEFGPMYRRGRAYQK